MNAPLNRRLTRENGFLARIRARFTPQRGNVHVEKRTQWLVKQHVRHPKVAAFNEVIRLSRMPDEAGKERKKIVNPDWSVIVNPSEKVSRKTLFELEKTVLEKGVEEAAMAASMEYPSLAEVLLQKNEYTDFVKRTCAHEKWKKNLLQLSETNPNVRAVGLLLYLRKAYRTPAQK